MAKVAKLEKDPSGYPWEGLSTLARLCLDLSVSPDAVKVRVSIADLAAMVEGEDIPPALVKKFAAAVGKALARDLPKRIGKADG